MVCKEKPVDSVEFAQQNGLCVMPECPYCPACRYAFLEYPDDPFDDFFRVVCLKALSD